MAELCVFVVSASSGTPLRVFAVPTHELSEEMADLEPVLSNGVDLDFTARDECRVLWLIGQRLGVASGGNEQPDLARYECSGAVATGRIRAVITGCC